jgi:hypothetical protein
MKLKSLSLGLVALLGVASLRATVLINIGADQLTGSDGVTPLADDALVLLIANGLDHSFSTPTVGSYLSGDDVLIQAIAIDQSQLSHAGSFFTAVTATLNSALTSGQSIKITWFPSKTIATMGVSPGSNVFYGEYLGDASPDWILPGDSGSISPSLVTLSGGGSLANTAGQASLNTSPIPEPSTYALLGGLAAFGLAAWRRRARADS